MNTKVQIAVVFPECARRDTGPCEAYQTLADNHRLAREQAISALLWIRKTASEHGRGEPSWDRDILAAIENECACWLRQWGVTTSTKA